MKWAGKLGAMSLPVAAVAAIGGPLAAALAAMLVVVVVALCWVLSDPTRTRHLVELIQAVRGSTPPADHG